MLEPEAFMCVYRSLYAQHSYGIKAYMHMCIREPWRKSTLTTK